MFTSNPLLLIIDITPQSVINCHHVATYQSATTDNFGSGTIITVRFQLVLSSSVPSDVSISSQE